MKLQHLPIPESSPPGAGRTRRVLSPTGVLLVLAITFLSGCEGTMVTPTVTWLPAEAPVPPIVAESRPDDVTGKTDSDATPSESESTEPAVTPSSDE